MRSIFEIAYVCEASRLELFACRLEPTSGQYILSVLDTSISRVIGCSSSLLASYYITGSYIQLGCIGMGANDTSEYIPHSLATAENDFLVASSNGVFVKKTLSEVKTILGI